MLGGTGVAAYLLSGLVAGDRHDLAVGTACLREASGGGFAQAVHRAVGETSLIAAGAEPVANACAGEWLTVRGDKERFSIGWQVSNGFGKLGGNGNAEEGLGFFLTDFDEAVFDILPTHADNIRAALSGVEREQHGKTRHAALWMAVQELGDLCIRPSVIAVAGDLKRLDAKTRIVIEQFVLNCKGHQAAHVFQELVGLGRRVALAIQHRLDVLAFEAVGRLAAMVFAEPLEDAAIGLLRIRSQDLELGRGIVFRDKRVDRTSDGVLRANPLRRFGAAQGCIIGFPEPFYTGTAGKRSAFAALLAELPAQFSMTVAIAACVRRLRLHPDTLSHGFGVSLSPPSTGRALKASSSCWRSQTLRPSIRRGFGMRPSSTIRSNFVTPTPTNSEATTRDNPRGARLTGRLLALRWCFVPLLAVIFVPRSLNQFVISIS